MTVRMVVMVLDVLEASGYHDASNPTRRLWYIYSSNGVPFKPWWDVLCTQATMELYIHQPKSGDPTGLCDLFHGYSVSSTEALFIVYILSYRYHIYKHIPYPSNHQSMVYPLSRTSYCSIFPGWPPWHQCCPHMNKNLVAWGLPLLKQPKNSHVDGSITIHRQLFMAKIHGFFETPSGPPQDLFQRGQQSFWTPEVCPVALPHVSKRLQRTGFGSAVELGLSETLGKKKANFGQIQWFTMIFRKWQDWGSLRVG